MLKYFKRSRYYYLWNEDIKDVIDRIHSDERIINKTETIEEKFNKPTTRESSSPSGGA